jgi:anaerobic selenocysteine-containing dehydrogenase
VFSAAEEEAREPVVVIERTLAQQAGATVGDLVTVATATGDVELRIVGVAKNQ